MKLSETERFPLDEQKIKSPNPEERYDYFKSLVKRLNDVYGKIANAINQNIYNPANYSLLASGRKLWLYENVAPNGWTIVAAAADALLAVKGGTQAYNVDGGTQAGTWIIGGLSDSGHTHGPGSYAVDMNYTATTGPNVFASDVQTKQVTGTSASGYANIAHSGTWRPLAQVGIIVSKD
jgi:hypothetical protein